MSDSKINHDLRSNQGRTIYMPEYFEGENGWGNLNIPSSIYAVDDATALYPRGTRLVQGERVFYYATYNGVIPAASATVTATNGDDLGGKFLFTYAGQTDMADSLLVRKLANEQSIVYNTTVSAARSNNYYAGGWVTGKDSTPSDERMFWRRIVKQEYQATGLAVNYIWNDSSKEFTEVDLSSYTYASILELDAPVINNKTSMATTLMANPYKYICWTSDTAYGTYRNVIGACMHNDPTATRSVWLQTYGPMFCPHVHAANVGASANERVVIVMGDGSIQVRESTYDYMDSHMQVVGFVLADTYASGSAADESLPMIYVTLHR